MVEHQGIAPCIPVWKTGVYLSTPMLVGNPVLELIQRLLCHTTSVVQGLRLEMNDALASAEYRSAVVNKPRDDVLKAALRSIRSLSRVEHAQFSQLAARKLTFGDAVSVASINLTRFGTVDRYLLGEVEAPRTVTLHETFRELCHPALEPAPIELAQERGVVQPA